MTTLHFNFFTCLSVFVDMVDLDMHYTVIQRVLGLIPGQMWVQVLCTVQNLCLSLNLDFVNA
jgi:hypothetical protein